MIKITHIITGLNTGGAEMMLYKLLAHTDRTIFAPEVISLIPVGSIGEKIQSLDILVKTLEMQPGIPSIRALVHLVTYLRQSSPDVVQTWMYHADLIGGVAAKIAGDIPISWGIQGTYDPEKRSRVTSMTMRTCALLSHWVPQYIISCSHVACSVHVSLGYTPRAMQIIPNGVDLQDFKPDTQSYRTVRDELSLAPDTLLIGMIARFNPQKDHHNFVQAAMHLHRFYPDVHFVLCGIDVTWDNYKLDGWIGESSARSHFHLLGLRNDIPRITAALDIATLSSAYGEGFPNVLGEAMACGVPCVVTDTGDSGLIVGSTGRVVPPRNPHALAAAWYELIEMESVARQQLGKQARQRVQEYYSLPGAVAQYAALHQELARIRHNQDT